MKELGKIIHYYPKIGVAIVELRASLKVGDKIAIKGSTTNFEQIVESMQIEHKDVQSAEAGKSIGLKVVQKVREGDIIHTAT
jgi:putative protease